MLTGSTQGLRSLPALSSQLTCRRLRNPALFVSGQLAIVAPLPRNGMSSTSLHPQSAPGERDWPGSREASAMNSHRGSAAHLLRSPIAVSANGTPSFSRSVVPSSIRPSSAEKDGADQLVGTGHPSDMQDRLKHGHMPWTRPPRTLGYIKRKCPAHRRRTLLWVMLTAKTPVRAWAAYEELLSHGVTIPHHLLHHLARLLASIKPRTRSVYLQLLSVLKTLERNRGRLRLWEWNTLIDGAGKQWHKTRLEDYENAFDIFNKRGALPARNTASADDAAGAEANSCLAQQNPDIWTYNILLSIASRSNLPLAVHHASSLLFASGLSPNRYTHLCLLRYFTARNDLPNIRSTLRKMKQQGLPVGLDGINACIWAYTRNGRFDVGLRIYRVLRSNVKPTHDPGEHDIEEDSRYIRDAVELDMLDDFEPDETTYTMMIQTLAYHGDLRNALSIFVDMLSTPNREATTRIGDTTAKPACYKPSMAAFRALFLGFARHGRDSERPTVDTGPIAMLFPSSRATWDLDALETVFAAFLQLPSFPKPTGRVVYWILVAFDKTSGNNTDKLREVWTKLEVKYGDSWGGRLEEIRRSIFT